MDSDGRNSVLIVDDETANIIALTHILSPLYTVYAAKDGQYAIEAAKKHSPDVILLDILMPDMDGYEVFSVLKNTEETKDIPVIFATGLGSDDEEEKGLAMGAADYITKPFKALIVQLRVSIQMQMLNQIDTIRQFSVTDQLTGIHNRRNFDDRLRFEWDHANRSKAALCIFMIDIDDFKEYNDRYGHIQGDAALQAVANVIQRSLKRSVDFAARWGGEEFTVLLPSTDLTGALAVAEQLRKNVEETTIPRADGELTRVTVSIGVNAHTPAKESSIDDFVSGADRALYDAKKSGKNKVCGYS